MAASSITFCANWQRKTNRMRFSLSSCTFAAFAALAVSACAPSDDAGKGGKGERAPGSSFGYELAVHETSDQGRSEAQPVAQMIDLTPAQLSEKIAAGNIRLIDVRTAEEVAEGIIPGAEHIPLDQFDPQQLSDDDGREIVLYCRSGRRSRIAGQALSEQSGEPAQHVAGGILAWQESGLETGTLTE